ncbi:MAG: RNA polymerase sigma factor [Lachnospiraceae bacterium]|nr:RNA polymerase sigma factor [Lachnospiraceae bacterium]
MSPDYKYIATLVLRTQMNDSNAFAELYALTYQKEYNFACNYLKDPILAQDALQETYIRVYNNISRLKNPRLFVSWIHSINFRICYTMLEKKKNNNEEFAEETYYNDIADPNPTRDPESATIRKSESQEFFESLNKLPSNEQQALIMRYQNQMSLTDIAQTMDCSLSTVKRYLLKGRTALQKNIKERRK